MALLAMAVLAAGCASKSIEGVCCIGKADCDRLGVPEDRPCPAGQTCVANQCEVGGCSVQGCTAAAPVCDPSADVCSGCTVPADCASYADQPVCDADTGACVACLGSADCSAATAPVCDDGACRACQRDSECDSGACGDDGACVPEDQIVYLAPDGVDGAAATCTRAAPCKQLQFATSRISSSRAHLVLKPGTYDNSSSTSFGPSLGDRVWIHGHNAKLVPAAYDWATFEFYVPGTVVDLEIERTNLSGVEFDPCVFTNHAELVLDRVTVGTTACFLNTAGSTIVRNTLARVEVPSMAAIIASGVLNLERSQIIGGKVGVAAHSSATIKIVSTLIYGARDTGVDARDGKGAIEHSTISSFGMDPATPGGLLCPAAGVGLATRASIIWPRSYGEPTSGRCGFLDTIAGPTAVPGADNRNPLFMNEYQNDYHLAPGSPARDAVATGPAFDFEGDPRPQGARFDLGADEAR